MKLTTILKVAAISFTAFLASCGDEKHDHAGHDHGDHDGHEHADGEKHDDHAGHEHDKEGHDDHTNCGVVVGANGGRMIEDVAELNLTDAGALTLTFAATPAEGTKVMVLHEGTPLELAQVENVYTSASITDKLPGEVMVKITEPSGKKITQAPFKLEAGKCAKCDHAKLACTCHNHDHDHGDHGHGDHEGHDH